MVDKNAFLKAYNIDEEDFKADWTGRVFRRNQRRNEHYKIKTGSRGLFKGGGDG